MLGFAVFAVLLQFGNVAATFSPSVTVTCAIGPTYTFVTTSDSSNGVIFIDGQCGTKATSGTGGTFTFAAADCAQGTVPALGTEFKLVIQEYSTINMATDYIVKVTCNLDTANVEKVVSVSATGQDFDETDSATVSPTFTVEMQDGDGEALTSGSVGDSAKVAFSIPSGEAAVFDYQILTLTVAASDSVDLITAGCPAFASIISKPSAPIAGALDVPFSLFIPKDTSSSAALPGTSAVAVTFTFTIKVCASTCPAVTCDKRKRRSVDSSNSTLEVELATSLMVYPAGHKGFKRMSNSGGEIDEENTNVCMSKAPLIGVMVALSGALVVCLGITVWLFCRLRNPIKGDKNEFSNMGYKS